MLGIEKITMPQLGESVTEGTIEKWLVQPGDRVEKYESIAEVNTDKVTAEMPSSFSGTITELVAQEGETVAVGETVCLIEASDAPIKKVEAKDDVPEQEVQNAQPAKQQKKAAGRYSPAVLHLSQEHGIDLSLVDGTGRGGRITRKDLQKIIDSGSIPQSEQEPKEQHTQPVKQEAEQERLPSMGVSLEEQDALAAVEVPLDNGDIEIPVTSVRRAIAKNMVRSISEAPHAWTMVEVDVTDLVQFRESIKDEFREKEGFNLTYFAFFIKAVSQALKEFPAVNSMWAGDKIVLKKDINISIAVATDEALYVPVIKHTDEKTIKAIARDIAELANKVRTGKLKAQDMQGGTFTVNNTGSFGSVQSMGIINYPQAAILQVETIVKRPVVMNNGMVAVRDIVNLCLSLDHRVLDGLICGRFLARVKELLENMSQSTTSVY